MTHVAEMTKAPPSPKARAEAGRTAQDGVPREAQGEWQPAKGRPDPVELLQKQAASRVQELIPIRYGRMLSSPFAFYRGAALIMANDLAGWPTTGFNVQLSGDAHVSNFGMFGTPERELLFDVNDFDETLPGPWEWDLKRLAASLTVAGRDRQFHRKDREATVAECVRSYRTAMAQFAGMHKLDVWYAHMDPAVLQQWKKEVDKRQVKGAKKLAGKAHKKDNTRGVDKLTTDQRGDKLRFLSQPPLLVPLEQLVPDDERARLTDALHGLLRDYATTLRPELRHLLSDFRVIDIARKVVGVGSVGMRAWVILLTGRDSTDALILQAKEAQASVLEQFVGPSEYDQHGERVVVGQRTMQTASDLFLGWIRTDGLDGVERDYYIRQLWDWKGSVDLDVIRASGLRVYGQMCGWALASAHARSGDPIAISAYLGSGDTFDRAIVHFAEVYADQNEKDYQALASAAESGRVPVEKGV